jgi:serine acetyltransferase
VNAPREMTVAELDQAGLLETDTGVQISRYALFCPTDDLGTSRVITLEAGAAIGAFAVIHGGTHVGSRARIEAHTVVGQPELGYAVGEPTTGRARQPRLVPVPPSALVQSSTPTFASEKAPW